MNIDGLSEATLEKFVDMGFIHEFADLFHLEQYQEQIVEMEGFGEKSYKNLIESINRARNTTLPRVIYGLGIANIGVANAKMLCRYFDHDLKRMQEADVETLSAIEGVGEVIATAFVNYMQDEFLHYGNFVKSPSLQTILFCVHYICIGNFLIQRRGFP